MVRNWDVESAEEAHQQFKLGFSTSQAVSGSDVILLAGTVALYAAKPASFGGTSFPPKIRPRAVDRTPSLGVSTVHPETKKTTFSSDYKISVVFGAILQSNRRRVKVVFYDFASCSHVNSEFDRSRIQRLEVIGSVHDIVRRVVRLLELWNKSCLSDDLAVLPAPK